MQIISHIRLFCWVVLLVLMVHSDGFGQRLTSAEWAQSIRNEGSVQESRRQLIGEIRAKVEVINTIKQKIAEVNVDNVARGKAKTDRPKDGRGILEMVLVEQEAELADMQEKLAHLQETAPPSVPLQSANRDRQINEMMALRDSLGGSVVGSVLGDLQIDGLSQEQLQADFHNELARLVLEGQQESPPKQPVLPPYLKTPTNLESSEARSLSVIREGNLNAKVEALQAVSRQLEQLAWQLEEVEAFEDADRLRQQATDLRHQSRRLVR